jgi:outer membrane protein assembly complex protein YaeT
MPARWLRVAVGLLLVCKGAVPVLAQTAIPAPGFSFERPSAKETSVVDSLEFIGLRHISSAAVRAQLSLHPGDRFDATKLRNDLRTLGRLGWFSSIRVQELSQTARNSPIPTRQEGLTLVLYFQEEPILSRVEYSGSRLLSRSQIEKLLKEKKLTPELGKPADPAALHQTALEIRTALNELGHPEASVQVRQEMKAHATVSVRFEIADGPHLPVRQIRFAGHPGISEKLLRAQMQNIAPWKPLASLRSKNAYTQSAFEEDRRRILSYFQDHGYPEARVGNARVEKIAEHAHKWVPFAHRTIQPGLLLTIPVDAGPFYRFEAIDATQTLQQAIASRRGKPFALPVTEQGRAFSLEDVDKLRRFYAARLRSGDSKSDTSSFQTVEARPVFDPDRHSVRLNVNLSDSPPYLVHRLEFQGLHKFNDRFVRRRIPLGEGHPLDEHALEIGLGKLARTGYFKPIRKEDVQIQLDDIRHTADVTIRLQEIGQQRLTFDGGRAQFGSTLGIAYTVFDLLNHEELLTARLEGGPESLQLLLSIAKEGIFGTRGSLAFSIFDNVIRPRFTHGLQGPFTNSRSQGINVPWTYALTNSDSIGVSYALTRTVSDQTFGTTSGTPTLPPIDLRTHTSSSSLGTAWLHDSGNEHVLFSNSASGSFLGGEENMLRSRGEAARIFRDPVFSRRNAWALRTSFSAAGSYHGNAPLYSRFFAGDQFVRGLRDGELGPVAMSERITPSGVIVPAPSYAGADLVSAANAEYRIPLGNGVEAAGFFDLGSGWLLPNWLGPTKPTLLSATNGILHGSTGVQFRWTIPAVQVPFRGYYALNVLRLDRPIPLFGKSFLHPHNRFGAFGWGLGSLF